MSRTHKRKKGRRKTWTQGELFSLLAEDAVKGHVRKRAGRFVAKWSHHVEGRMRCPVCGKWVKWYRTRGRGLLYAHCLTNCCIDLQGV